jgi:signal transduction histidine kinase
MTKHNNTSSTIPQPTNDRQAILRDCARINFGRVRLFAAVLLAVHCFLLYRDIAVLRPEGYWQRNIGYQHLCTMHAILVAAMILFLLLSLVIVRLPEAQERWRRLYNSAFAWCVLLWCAVMAGWVNQHEHGLITEYVIAIFGIAASFYFPPVQSLILFVSAQIVFMLCVAGMLPNNPNYSGHYTNSLSMVIIAWVLARTSFQLTAKNITNQEIIRRQTLALETSNVELIQKNARLELMDNEKTELMGIVAHDLKNPITAVRGLAEILREEHLEQTMRINILNQLTHVNDQMLELVKNLLDINHLESGLIQLGHESFDVMPFVESVLDQYTMAASLKNITLHPPDTLVSSSSSLLDSVSDTLVYANEQAVMQVLDNLVSNAVKYSPLGKHVFVHVRNTGSEVRIEVQDEGPGLSAEDMTKLFGKFARLSAQPTGGEHSTGLGLSIVKKMVEAMNGRVWCESELGEGARFIVELPKSE